MKNNSMQSPVIKHLFAWLALLVAIVVNHLAGPKGVVTITESLALNMVLATGGLLVSISYVA